MKLGIIYNETLLRIQDPNCIKPYNKIKIKPFEKTERLSGIYNFSRVNAKKNANLIF